MQEGSICFYIFFLKNYFKNLNELFFFFKYDNFLKVFLWEVDIGVYLIKSIILQRSYCFFIKFIQEGVGKRESIFFFFLVIVNFLLIVIDKVGRKKIYEIYFEVDKYRYKINLNRNLLL